MFFSLKSDLTCLGHLSAEMLMQLIFRYDFPPLLFYMLFCIWTSVTGTWGVCSALTRKLYIVKLFCFISPKTILKKLGPGEGCVHVHYLLLNKWVDKFVLFWFNSGNNRFCFLKTEPYGIIEFFHTGMYFCGIFVESSRPLIFSLP